MHSLEEAIKPLEEEYENKLKELKEVLIDKYGEKITEDLFDIEQPEWGRETLKERIAEAEHEAKKKISVGDIAKTTGSEIIKRTLTKLATPKEATDTKQVKGPEQKQKQIQSSKTDSSSTNKLLKALSLFKRASPVGAALYTMKPTELARDDDYGFEIPVDR